MRKLSKFYLMAAAALTMGFASCSSDDLPNGGESAKANTHVAVALSLGQSTRALPDDYNPVGTYVGKDEIKTVDIYLVDGATVSHTPFTIDDYDVTSNTTTDNTLYLKPKTAIKTTSGIKTVYVLINGTTDVKNALAKTTAADFKAAYEQNVLALANDEATATTSASKLIGAATDPAKEAIAMTNLAGVSINVAPNVTDVQTLATTNPQNRASVTVERAVARVMVTTAQDSYDVPSQTGGVSIGSLSNITWVVAQGESALYIQRQANWVTPSYDWNPGVGLDDFYSQAAGKYDYSGLFENNSTGFGGTTVPTLTNYATEDAGTIGDKSVLQGKFLLPNTHLYAAAPTGNTAYTGGYKKGNTAYVLVRAKFSPKIFADAGTSSDGTFYLGGKDGLFYTSAQAAYDKGNTTIAKYPKGKVLYYAWLNPDNVPTWYNSPVLRNNIYHIHIKGFKNLGTNWNPLYPENPDGGSYDPVNPKNPDPRPVPDKVTDPSDPGNPVTPKEPENPIDPKDPLTTPETYMSVDVTVMPWLVHSYGVDLGL